jgi:hypothetical protein
MLGTIGSKLRDLSNASSSVFMLSETSLNITESALINTSNKNIESLPEQTIVVLKQQIIELKNQWSRITNGDTSTSFDQHIDGSKITDDVKAPKKGNTSKKTNKKRKIDIKVNEETSNQQIATSEVKFSIEETLKSYMQLAATIVEVMFSEDIQCDMQKTFARMNIPSFHSILLQCDVDRDTIR